MAEVMKQPQQQQLSPCAAAAAAGEEQRIAAQPQREYTSLDEVASRKEIYRGRHSAVWTCVCRRSGRPLVLKGYVKAKMTPRNHRQVAREARLMRLLGGHAGVVALLGHFEDGEHVFLVQERCGGGDLFRALAAAGGALDEAFVARRVLLPLLLTLEHCHARRIYHRDIKPENIFLTDAGDVKLGDFGLAIDAGLERAASRVGTLDYMAPEVAGLPTADERKRLAEAGTPAQERPYGEKCDVWAMGVLAYELLSGRPPFEVPDEAETRRRIVAADARPPPLPAHVSAEAARFIDFALSKSASARPTAAELARHPWLAPHLRTLSARGLSLAAAAAAAATPGLSPSPHKQQQQQSQPSPSQKQQQQQQLAQSHPLLDLQQQQHQPPLAPAAPAQPHPPSPQQLQQQHAKKHRTAAPTLQTQLSRKALLAASGGSLTGVGGGGSGTSTPTTPSTPTAAGALLPPWASPSRAAQQAAKLRELLTRGGGGSSAEQ